MHIRFELKKGFKHHEVAEWMVKRFGPACDEGENKTWFWSSGDFYETPNPCYPGVMDQHCTPDGIQIWKEGPAVTEAILKWSR